MAQTASPLQVKFSHAFPFVIISFPKSASQPAIFGFIFFKYSSAIAIISGELSFINCSTVIVPFANSLAWAYMIAVP